MLQKSITLNERQKEYIWNTLGMCEVYCYEDNKYSKFEDAKECEWRLDYSGCDDDYPWELFVDIGVWDHLRQDFVDKVLQIKE